MVIALSISILMRRIALVVSVIVARSKNICDVISYYGDSSSYEFMFVNGFSSSWIFY